VVVFILDSTSLLAFEALCTSVGQRNTFFSKITTLAISGELICPASVIAECFKYAKEASGTTWARSVKGHFKDASEQWQHFGDAMDLCPGLSDENGLDEQTSVDVVALGLYRSEKSQQVVIVTDDWVDGPTTICLGHSAPKAKLEVISAQDFVSEVLARP
jgi:hypothetical protein